MHMILSATSDFFTFTAWCRCSTGAFRLKLNNPQMDLIYQRLKPPPIGEGVFISIEIYIYIHIERADIYIYIYLYRERVMIINDSFDIQLLPHSFELWEQSKRPFCVFKNFGAGAQSGNLLETSCHCPD